MSIEKAEQNALLADLLGLGNILHVTQRVRVPNKSYPTQDPILFYSLKNLNTLYFRVINLNMVICF